MYNTKIKNTFNILGFKHTCWIHILFTDFSHDNLIKSENLIAKKDFTRKIAKFMH